MVTHEDPVFMEAMKNNPTASVKYRQTPGHNSDCVCTGCTPVLTENIWYGDDQHNHADPVPQNNCCDGCGKPLVIAVRGLLEVMGSYTLIQRWYHRCTCITNTNTSA